MGKSGKCGETNKICVLLTVSFPVVFHVTRFSRVAHEHKNHVHVTQGSLLFFLLLFSLAEISFGEKSRRQVANVKGRTLACLGHPGCA